ncbi:hypothetical protein ACFW04_013872 [Cataglyphis niger]
MNLNKKCSSFTAEACAIAKALQYMIKQSWKKNIIIYIDSLSKKIVFCWIPAHQGITSPTGNEKADELAKEAAKDVFNEELEIPIRDFRRRYKNEMFKKTIKDIKDQGRYKGIHCFTKFFNENEDKL